MPNAFESGPRRSLISAEIKDESGKQRNELVSGVVREQMEKDALAATSPDQMQASINKTAQMFLDDMQVTGEALSQQLAASGWEGRVAMAFSHTKEEKDTAGMLQEIAAKLAKHVPPLNNKTGIRHPYVAQRSQRMHGPHKAMLHECHITHALYEDLRNVQTIKTIPHLSAEQLAVVNELETALRTYAKKDTRQQLLEEASRAKQESATSRGINKMIRISGGLGFGGLTVLLSGVVLAKSIANKQFNPKDLTALGIYAGITAAFAFPSLFDGKNRKILTQLRRSKTIGTPEFKKAADKMPPAAGAALSVKLMDPAVNNVAMVNKIMDGKASDAEKTAYAESVTTDPVAQKNVRAFLDDTESLVAFAVPLRNVTDKDAQTVVEDYLRISPTAAERQALERVRELGLDETQMA